MASPKGFSVVYRTGGTENFQWHRINFATELEARKAWAETIVGGRKAYLWDTMDAPIPETHGDGISRAEMQNARMILG